MNFERIKVERSSLDVILGRFGDLSWYDNTPFTQAVNFYPKIEADKIYREGTNTICLKWIVSFYHKESKECGFNCELDYWIVEEEVAPTKTQLERIIKESYLLFQKSFEEKRKEVTIVPPIEDISEDTIQRTLSLLMELLSD